MASYQHIATRILRLPVLRFALRNRILPCVLAILISTAGLAASPEFNRPPSAPYGPPAVGKPKIAPQRPSEVPPVPSDPPAGPPVPPRQAAPTGALVLPAANPEQLESERPAPEGYVLLKPLKGNANVPGSTTEERETNLREFFLTNYPLLEKDPEGCDALVKSLGQTATDFRGQINMPLYNLTVAAYNHYTHIAAHLDTLPLPPEAISSHKRYYAHALVIDGARNISPSALRAAYKPLFSGGRAVKTNAFESPEQFMLREWPYFNQLSGTEKAQLLDALLAFNPWLRREFRSEVGDKKETRMAIAGQTDIVHELNDKVYLSFYTLTEGEYVLLPSDALLLALSGR